MIDGYEDEELVRLLIGCRFGGTLGAAFEVVAWARCRADISAMLRDGSLSARTAALHRPIRLSGEERLALLADDHAWEQMVADAYVRQLDYFRTRTLAEQGWEPGGLTLRRYFVNGVLLHLKNEVRTWWRARRRVPDTAGREEFRLPALPDADLGPEERLLVLSDTTELIEAMSAFDPVLCRAVLIRRDTGRSWARIAAAVRLSPSTLNRRRAALVRHLHEHLRNDMNGDGS